MGRTRTIIQRRIAWEAAARSGQPLTLPRNRPAPPLDPRPVLALINQLREAQDIESVSRLTLQHATPRHIEECVVGLALRCNANEFLLFEDRWRAERVAQRLGTRLDPWRRVRTPRLLLRFMCLFDHGRLCEGDLWIPRYEQLDFEQSPVDQALEALATVGRSWAAKATPAALG